MPKKRLAELLAALISLSEATDELKHALYFNRSLNEAQVKAISRWVASASVNLRAAKKVIK
jgi:hypothetical protein